MTSERHDLLHCFGCAAAATVLTPGQAAEQGWRRKRGRWHCPSCCRDPYNAAAVNRGRSTLRHRTAPCKVPALFRR